MKRLHEVIDYSAAIESSKSRELRKKQPVQIIDIANRHIEGYEKINKIHRIRAREILRRMAAMRKKFSNYHPKADRYYESTQKYIIDEMQSAFWDGVNHDKESK